jgi:hypothetical protein
MLLKNTFQKLSSSASQNAGCGMGGSLAYYGALNLQYRQGQRGTEVGMHPEGPWVHATAASVRIRTRLYTAAANVNIH